MDVEETLAPARIKRTWCRDEHDGEYCALYLSHFGPHRSNHGAHLWEQETIAE